MNMESQLRLKVDRHRSSIRKQCNGSAMSERRMGLINATREVDLDRLLEAPITEASLGELVELVSDENLMEKVEPAKQLQVIGIAVDRMQSQQALELLGRLGDQRVLGKHPGLVEMVVDRALEMASKEDSANTHKIQAYVNVAARACSSFVNPTLMKKICELWMQLYSRIGLSNSVLRLAANLTANGVLPPPILQICLRAELPIHKHVYVHVIVQNGIAFLNGQQDAILDDLADWCMRMLQQKSPQRRKQTLIRLKQLIQNSPRKTIKHLLHRSYPQQLLQKLQIDELSIRVFYFRCMSSIVADCSKQEMVQLIANSDSLSRVLAEYGLASLHDRVVIEALNLLEAILRHTETRMLGGAVEAAVEALCYHPIYDISRKASALQEQCFDPKMDME